MKYTHTHIHINTHTHIYIYEKTDREREIEGNELREMNRLILWKIQWEKEVYLPEINSGIRLCFWSI